MRKIAAITTVLILTAAAFAKGPLWFEGSLDEAKALAQAEGKQILIGFVSDY